MADDHQAVIAEALKLLHPGRPAPQGHGRAPCCDAVESAFAALASLTQQLQNAEKALEAIARNAEAWHGNESVGTGAYRALAVIAGWARDPSSVPAALAAAGTDDE